VAKNLAADSYELTGRAEASERRLELRLVEGRVAPLALANDLLLPVLEPLAPLFPNGALRRGSVVGVTGTGSTSLGLAVAAGPSQAGSWVSLVDDDGEVGLVAAQELGIALERVLVVRPGREWASTLAGLVGAVDVVVIAGHCSLGQAKARRIMARLRERGSVLVAIGHCWPIGADVTLHVASSDWEGLGRGHGLLQSRRLSIVGGGKGAASRPRALDVLAPGPDGAVASLVV